MSIDAFRKRLASMSYRIEHDEAIDFQKEGELLMLDVVDDQLRYTQEAFDRQNQEDERLARHVGDT
uniref:Uncharacterized protein n=1 Tax=viral metagenome TaxID=1070528 RepID=A0A6M3KVJ1_9ZZZZ